MAIYNSNITRKTIDGGYIDLSNTGATVDELTRKEFNKQFPSIMLSSNISPTVSNVRNPLNIKANTWQSIAGIDDNIDLSGKKRSVKSDNVYSIYQRGVKQNNKLMGLPKAKLNYQKPNDTTGELTDDLKKKEADLNTGSPDVTKTANILSGINTGVNAALGIYGAIQASKQKPVLASYQAPIEPDLVDDNTEAIKVAGEEKIDKAVNTSREQARRLGISDNTSIGKETEALNQLSGQLAQYKSAIDAQNIGMKNQFKQYNDQAERQRGQFNAQTQNQFNIYQSQLMGQALSGVATNITSGMDAITHNLNYRQVKAEAQKESEIDRYWSIYANKDISADDKAIAIRELRKRGVTI